MCAALQVEKFKIVIMGAARRRIFSWTDWKLSPRDDCRLISM
jgi:hypothetical protein